jgi:hypothetical protein
MNKPAETFGQIEEFSRGAADASIAALRRALKVLHKDPPPVDDTPCRERWQSAHDRIRSALDQKVVQRRLVASLIFAAATLLIIATDLFFW